MRLPRPSLRAAGLRPLAPLLSALLLAAALTACGAGGGHPGQSSSGVTTTNPGATNGTGTTQLPGTGKPQVTIGDKNFTEQFVLGELYTLALQAQGYTVALNENIGPTAVTMQALGTGALDMYPEYLNVFNSAIAHQRRTFNDETAAYAAAQRYAGSHGLALLTATPFSDTPALAVTAGYASANQLHSLNDLSRVSASMVLGGPPEFQQMSPGLVDIERNYDFRVHTFKDLAVGDQYTALDQGTVTVADVNTTDGQLDSPNYVLLADPQNTFGWGNAIPVVSRKTLDREGPDFAVTIDRVSALLSTTVMRQLNALVDVAGEDPATVARTFLETHGVIPPAS